MKTNWIAIKDKIPPIGIEFLGYNPEWINEDFNPKGVRIWFHDDMDWYSAKYNNTHDCWDTTEEDKPTHWMELPYFSTPKIEAEGKGLPTDEEIYKFINERRAEKRGVVKGGMSIHRLSLGEIDWIEICSDLAKWMRSQLQSLPKEPTPSLKPKIDYVLLETKIREHCNMEFNKNTGEEEVHSSLSAVCIAFDEYLNKP